MRSARWGPSSCGSKSSMSSPLSTREPSPAERTSATWAQDLLSLGEARGWRYAVRNTFVEVTSSDTDEDLVLLTRSKSCPPNWQLAPRDAREEEEAPEEVSGYWVPM